MHDGGAAALAAALARWGGRPFGVDANCLLLRGPRGVQMVDAGTGPSRCAHLGLARAAPGGLGAAPEEIDRVLLTHLPSTTRSGCSTATRPSFPAPR